MNNIKIRLTFFCFAFPALLAMIIFLPHAHHLAFNLLVVTFLGFSAAEVAKIFRNRGIRLSSVTAYVLGAGVPSVTYLGAAGILPAPIPSALFIFTCMFLLAREIFHPNEEYFQDVLLRLAAYFFILIYPGYFSSFVVRMTFLPHAGFVLLVFFAGTYLNDSAAWASGVLWGKNSRNILAVSPNKSLVGFVFGFGGSIFVVVGLAFLFPGYIPLSLPSAAVIGIALGAATILGDLAESSLKRSGVIKDSGTIIPGRGGFLDSIDSPLYGAPIFYYLFTMLASGGVQ